MQVVMQALRTAGICHCLYTPVAASPGRVLLMPKWVSDRERLAQHMDERRVDLDLRWTDVAELAGVTTETLRQARTGTGDIRPRTKRGIEVALRWERGSVKDVLAGGDPTPVDAKIRDHLPPLSASLAGRDELRALIDQLADADVEAVRRFLAALVKQI